MTIEFRDCACDVHSYRMDAAISFNRYFLWHKPLSQILKNIALRRSKQCWALVYRG